MIPIYLCDDEVQITSVLEAIIKKYITILALDMGPIHISDNPEMLLAEIKEKNERAIYFLDVDFPEHKNGFELATEIRQIDPRGFIVFITAHTDLAIETFRYRLEAMDYIVKDNEELLKEKVQSCLVSIEQRLCDETNENFFTLKILDELRHIPTKQILYFEAVGYNHQIRLQMQNEVIDFYGTLQKLELELGNGFWRCHRGYLVNIYHVSRIYMKEKEVELDNKEKCLMSRRAKLNIPNSLKVKI